MALRLEFHTPVIIRGAQCDIHWLSPVCGVDCDHHASANWICKGVATGRERSRRGNRDGAFWKVRGGELNRGGFGQHFQCPRPCTVLREIDPNVDDSYVRSRRLPVCSARQGRLKVRNCLSTKSVNDRELDVRRAAKVSDPLQLIVRDTKGAITMQQSEMISTLERYKDELDKHSFSDSKRRERAFTLIRMMMPVSEK